MGRPAEAVTTPSCPGDAAEGGRGLSAGLGSGRSTTWRHGLPWVSLPAGPQRHWRGVTRTWRPGRYCGTISPRLLRPRLGRPRLRRAGGGWASEPEGPAAGFARGLVPRWCPRVLSEQSLQTRGRSVRDAQEWHGCPDRSFSTFTELWGHRVVGYPIVSPLTMFEP